MRINLLRNWVPVLAAAFFMASCAGRHTPSSPELPAENLPQIGSRQASLSKEKTPRPQFLSGLIQKAEQQIQEGRTDEAFATLERGLSIDASDPLIWHLMAVVRLTQGNWTQAGQLARKSNLLAGHDTELKNKNQIIITQATEQQSNPLF